MRRRPIDAISQAANFQSSYPVVTGQQIHLSNSTDKRGHETIPLLVIVLLSIQIELLLILHLDLLHADSVPVSIS